MIALVGCLGVWGAISAELQPIIVGTAILSVIVGRAWWRGDLTRTLTRKDSGQKKGARAWSAERRSWLAVGVLGLTPVALIARSYGGASVLVAVSGWVLADARSLRDIVTATTRRGTVAKTLLLAGAAGFAVTFVYNLSQPL